MTSVFTDDRFYLHLYDIIVIPMMCICCGLVLKMHEKALSGEDNARVSKGLKAMACAFTAGAAGFVCWRLGVRTYELIRTCTDESYSVWLPFTLMENYERYLCRLPVEDAVSHQAYIKVVLFRYLRDLPVFALTSAAVWQFVRLLLNTANNELNTARNRRHLRNGLILLLTASVILNGAGFYETYLFDRSFTGIFGNTTYTMALRSMTEPMLYCMVLWFFGTYLQAIPAADEPANA